MIEIISKFSRKYCVEIMKILIITSTWWDSGWLSLLILLLCIVQVSCNEHVLFNDKINLKRNHTKMEGYSWKVLLEEVMKLWYDLCRCISYPEHCTNSRPPVAVCWIKNDRFVSVIWISTCPNIKYKYKELTRYFGFHTNAVD